FSDHGESLGDHGENTHGYFIYQSTLHVPLIIHWPQTGVIRNSKVETRNSGPSANFEFPVSLSAWHELQSSKRADQNSDQSANFGFGFSSFAPRVSSPAGLIDAAPTVLSYLGIPSPESFCGHSLLDLARGGTSQAPDMYSESFYAHEKFG